MARNNRVAKNLINIQPGDVFHKEYSSQNYIALNVYNDRIYCVKLGNDTSFHYNMIANIPEHYTILHPLSYTEDRGETKVVTEFYNIADLDVTSIPSVTRGSKIGEIDSQEIQNIKNKIKEVLNIAG